MRPWFPLMTACLAVLSTGCRQDMYDQPRYEPQEASKFFTDGKSDRPILPSVVHRPDPKTEPRDELYDHYNLGIVDGEPAETFPFPIDRTVLDRGRQRYQIYCTPCHGERGDGQGMIVKRGFSPPPPFYGERPPTGKSPAATIYADLREAPVGHFFEVITKGHGAMYSYASRIGVRDRWSIIAYVRALQLSRYATESELPQQDRDQLSKVSR